MVAINAAIDLYWASLFAAHTYGFNSSTDSIVKSFHLYGVLLSVAGRMAWVAMRACSSV